jgi:hypothetical protein
MLSQRGVRNKGLLAEDDECRPRMGHEYTNQIPALASLSLLCSENELEERLVSRSRGCRIGEKLLYFLENMHSGCRCLLKRLA